MKLCSTIENEEEEVLLKVVVRDGEIDVGVNRTLIHSLLLHDEDFEQKIRDHIQSFDKRLESFNPTGGIS